MPLLSCSVCPGRVKEAMSLRPEKLVEHLTGSLHHRRIRDHPHPFLVAMDGFHQHYVHYSASIASPSPHTLCCLSPDRNDAIRSYPARFVGDQAEQTVCSEEPRVMGRIRPEDVPIRQTEQLPVSTPEAHSMGAVEVVLEPLDHAVYEKYFQKYCDGEAAALMSKTAERISQRKRKADPLPLAVVSNTSARGRDRKRTRADRATSSCRSLALSQPPALKKTKRLFCDLPGEVPIPSIFGLLLRKETYDEFVDVPDPEPDPPFVSPFLQFPLFGCLTFEELMELSDEPQVLDNDQTRESIDREEVINVRDLMQTRAQVDDLQDRSFDKSPPPPAIPADGQMRIGACAEPAVSGPVESSESLKSPPLPSAAPSPPASPIKQLAAPSPPALPIKQLPSPPKVAQMKLASPGTKSIAAPETRTRCEHCFLSALQLTPQQMLVHCSHAHPDVAALPSISPPHSSRR